jgi:hypothetical protein
MIQLKEYSGKCITLSAYVRGKVLISDLRFFFKKLEKEEQIRMYGDEK